MIDPQPAGTGAGAIDPNVLMQRVRRLFTLDTSIFDEVRMDRSATIPAIIVAAGSIFVFALGGWLWWVINGPDNFEPYIDGAGEMLLKSVVLGTIFGVIFWAGWVGVTYVMLHQVFRARVDLNELVRVMGFAAAPLAAGILMFLPEVEFGVALAAVALFFGSTMIAVQSATDAPAGRVLAATAAGFLLWAALLGLFVNDFDNPLGPGIFVFDLGVEFLKS
jgi:hypothetical protein